MVEYFGIFFNEENSKIIFDNEKQHLEFLPNNFHCTFAFRPNQIELFNQFVGMDVGVTLIGYDNNNANSGFEIAFDEKFKDLFKNFDKNGNPKTPHITTSLAKGARAVNTCDLRFSTIKPINITGKFGYFVIENNKGFISFDKQKTLEQEKN